MLKIVNLSVKLSVFLEECKISVLKLQCLKNRTQRQQTYLNFASSVQYYG